MNYVIKAACLAYLLGGFSLYATDKTDQDEKNGQQTINPIVTFTNIEPVHVEDSGSTAHNIDPLRPNQIVNGKPIPLLPSENPIADIKPIKLPQGVNPVADITPIPLSQGVNPIAGTKPTQLPRVNPMVYLDHTVNVAKKKSNEDVLRKALKDVREMVDKMQIKYKSKLQASDQPLGDDIGEDVLRDLSCDFKNVDLENIHSYALLGADFRHYEASSVWNVVNRGDFTRTEFYKNEYYPDLKVLKDTFAAHIIDMKLSARYNMERNYQVKYILIDGLLGGAKSHKASSDNLHPMKDISIISPDFRIFEYIARLEKRQEYMGEFQEWEKIDPLAKRRFLTFIDNLKTYATTAVAISHAVAYMRARNNELKLLNITDLPYPTFNVYETRGELFESIRTRDDLKQALFEILAINPENIESALRVYSAHNIISSIINIFDEKKFSDFVDMIADDFLASINPNLQYAVRREDRHHWFVPTTPLHSEIKRMSQYELVKRCPFFI